MREKIPQSHKFNHYIENEIIKFKSSNAASLKFELPLHLKFGELFVYKTCFDVDFSDWLVTLDKFGIYYYLSIETRYVWLRSKLSESDVIAQLLDLRLGRTLFSDRTLTHSKKNRTLCLPIAVAHWRFIDLAESLEKLYMALPIEYHSHFFEILPNYVWHWSANIDYPEWNEIDTNLEEFLKTASGLKSTVISPRVKSLDDTKPNIIHLIVSNDMYESALYVAGTDSNRYTEQQLIDFAKEFVLDFIKERKIAEQNENFSTFCFKNFPLFIDRKFVGHKRSVFFVRDMKFIDLNQDLGPTVLAFNAIIPKKYSNYLWIDFTGQGCRFGHVEDIFALKNGLDLENNPNVVIWTADECVWNFSIS